MVYYSTSVFRSAGIASDVAASALVGASNVFGELILYQSIPVKKDIQLPISHKTSHM